jgi:hypothetical protein
MRATIALPGGDLVGDSGQPVGVAHEPQRELSLGHVVLLVE